MASTTSVAAVSEAEFGCEHLRALLEKDEATAGQFQTTFIQAHTSLSMKLTHATTSSPFPSLKPTYSCLGCPEVCLPGGRKTHSAESGHIFFMDSRSGAIFCQGCKDLIYDHDLEKLRLLAPGMPPKSILRQKRKFQESDSEADEFYVKTNATKKPCSKEGVRGLFNLGQTCYMNVILQTLLHDPLLAHYFLGNGHQTHECAIPNCIGCALSEAFAEFSSGDKVEGFGALNLLVASWKASSALSGYQQQDAHEYYQFLVDKLHGTTTGHLEGHGKCRCFFHKAFYGRLQSSVTCDTCSNVTKTEDPIMDLSLDVQVQAKKRALGGGGSTATPTLAGCLESFTSPERLMADVYNCSGCGGTPQKATKQLKIKRLPAILCMQLKRFEHTFTTSEKVEGKVDFPFMINMLPYTTRPNSQKVDKFAYDLSSVVVHKGKLDAGHYYAYCKQGDKWFLFNDDQVTAVSETEVLAADAYLLFYTLHSLSGLK